MEQVKTITDLIHENLDRVVGINCDLEVLDHLQSQVTWLQESFESVEYNKVSPELYFHDWKTKLTVINALFYYLNKDLQKKGDELEKYADILIESTH